jgi:hypothetical protein
MQVTIFLEHINARAKVIEVSSFLYFFPFVLMGKNLKTSNSFWLGISSVL